MWGLWGRLALMAVHLSARCGSFAWIQQTGDKQHTNKRKEVVCVCACVWWVPARRDATVDLCSDTQRFPFPRRPVYYASWAVQTNWSQDPSAPTQVSAKREFILPYYCFLGLKVNAIVNAHGDLTLTKVGRACMRPNELITTYICTRRDWYDLSS